MQKIFKIHPMSYIIALLAVLTANFKLYLIFISLIIIHELGHVFASLLFKWKIEKIILLPLGAITIYNQKINTPLKEEFIVSIMGIIFQIVFYNMFYKNNILYSYCNKIILIFNLIPIYPLDGSKILNIFFNKIFSFKNSYLLTIYLSFLLLIIFFLLSIVHRDLLLIISLLLLFIGLIKEYKKIPSILNKFYLERYLYNFNFNKIRNIKGNNYMKIKKDYNHYFYLSNKIYNEKELLERVYK